MTTVRDVQRLRRSTDKVYLLARRDLARFWSRLDLSQPELVRNALVTYVPTLVNMYGDIAGTAALEWYEDLREQVAGLPRYAPTIGENIPREAIEHTVKWAAGHLWGDNPDDTLRVLNGSMDRWMKYSQRDTIRRCIAGDPSKPRWARVPQGAKTCAWCTMLASRGWVYTSPQKAGDASHRFHDHCDCEIVPEWDRKATHMSGYDPDRYYALYTEAQEAVGGVNPSVNEIVKKMRELHPEEYKDGKWPPLPKGASKDGTLQANVYEKWRRDIAVLLPPGADPVRFKIPPEQFPEIPGGWPSDLPQLRAIEWNHVLYGDKRGGGHLAGYGWTHNGKEFPADWTPQDIRDAAEQLLREHPITPRGKNRGHSEGTVNGVKMTIYTSTKRGHTRIAGFYPDWDEA
ncbi:EndoU domain-containing protein [Actinobaculum sp. 352]|uniref:VG15 protein n=1 Tax=Actinobaculum sp. 352 TaxID=2490946 RepID=UPI000F7F75F2|nr:EndoU domain-containing protein [Actinobaculum sp. 352]RTE48818.1 hypothetical protein EKN07_08935 [Actinobaculum sp. 352]